ncbi:MAG TPA: class C beta-lactamase-related serine hydrolase [Bacteroides sp.]|nr:class C beta-lactamase-related serine hydrolase [Bacteroides sp.]
MKKLLIRLLYIILIGILVFVVIYAWPRVPIITAFAAKGMCSSVFIAGKDPDRVYAEDLSFFPISLAKTVVNYEEKSVTAKVFGLAKRKAVFREGLGSVLVLDIPEEQLREASFQIPDPGYSQDTVPWPLGDILTESRPEGVDYTELQAFVSNAIDPPGAEPFKKTLAVVVVYDGELVAEEYLNGYDYQTEFHGWSMTKSITSALVGILAGKGEIDIKAPVDIPEWKDDERGKITMEDLLHMSSGLTWVENYFTISEATIMLMQSSNMFDFVVSRPIEHTPGSHYYYSSGDANLVSGLIRKTFEEDRGYYEFPYKYLLHRIGILNTTIETDASGNFVSSSYSYGTARDYARFGLLYQNNGVFLNDTVLPYGWVDFTRQEAPAANANGEYGVNFWLDDPDPEISYQGLPDDVYSANGFLGQRIFIIPSKNLVVVRLGFSSKNFSHENFLKDIISTLPE